MDDLPLSRFAREKLDEPTSEVFAQGAFSTSVFPRERLRGRAPRRLVALIKEHADGDRLIAEVGSGTGVLTGALIRAGCRVLAIERDAPSVAQLRRSLGAAPIVRADPEALPLRCDSVSVVVLDPGLLHGDPAGLEQELHRVITPDSLVIAIRPSWDEVPVAMPDWLQADAEERTIEGSVGEMTLAVSVWSVVERTGS